MPDPVNRLSAQKGASLIPASVSEPSGHYTFCIWSSPSFLISGAADSFHPVALLAVVDASQTLFATRNPVVLRSKKLPFVFLHGTLLPVFMGRRTPAFGSVPPPAGGFWMSGGITTLSLKYSDTGRRKRNISFRIFELQSQCNEKSRAQKSNPYLADDLSQTCVTLLRPAIWWCFITLTVSAPRCSVSQSSMQFYGFIIANLCSVVNKESASLCL